jgi:hypothetical protein
MEQLCEPRAGYSSLVYESYQTDLHGHHSYFRSVDSTLLSLHDSSLNETSQIAYQTQNTAKTCTLMDCDFWPRKNSRNGTLVLDFIVFGSRAKWLMPDFSSDTRPILQVLNDPLYNLIEVFLL